MSQPLAMIQCPNPDHHDFHPSCALYSDGAYCFSQCGRISRQQIEEWTGESYEAHCAGEGRRIYTSRSNNNQPLRPEELNSYVECHHRTLMDGPRSSRTEWFLGRGFTERSLLRFKFGHTGTHFVIPLWQDEKLVGYKRRRDDHYLREGPKYVNQFGHQTTLVRPYSRGTPTILLEGELDAYLLSQYGFDSVSATTGIRGIRRCLDGVNLPISFVLPDMDTVGLQHGEEASNALGATTVLLPNGKDTTEYLGSIDPTERGAAIRSLLRRAERQRRQHGK